jgi:hypothetical protein
MQVGARLKAYPQNWYGSISGLMFNSNHKDSELHLQLIGKASSSRARLILIHTRANPS